MYCQSRLGQLITEGDFECAYTSEDADPKYVQFDGSRTSNVNKLAIIIVIG